MYWFFRKDSGAHREQDVLVHALPKNISVKRVLILDGFEKNVSTFLQKRFPNTHQEIGTEDTSTFLSNLTGSFDLIFSDALEHRETECLPLSPESIKRLQHFLRPYGYLLTHATRREPLDVFSPTFICERVWQERGQWFALFRQHGAGVRGDQLPEGYTRYDEADAYLQREFQDWKRFHLTSCDNLLGIEARLGPLRIEQFFGNKEPICAAQDRARWIIWYPTTYEGQPPGWHRSPFYNYRRKTGFTQIKVGEEYWKHWSELAQRQRTAWQKQQDYILSPVSIEEYCDVYQKKSGKKQLIIDLFSEAVRRKARRHGDRLRMIGVRRRQDQRLVGGFVALDIPEVHLSYHVTSFILDEARKSPVGVAMVDEWFRQGQAAGIHFFDFDVFWAPGDPTEWKGFSRFKGQFNVWYILYPKPLMRWIKAKKSLNERAK